MSELNNTQIEYLKSLRVELKNLELLGKTNTTEWWAVAESIDEIIFNL